MSTATILMIVVIGTAVVAAVCCDEMHGHENDRKKPQREGAIVDQQDSDQEGLNPEPLTQSDLIPYKTGPQRNELIVNEEGLKTFIEKIIDLKAKQIPDLPSQLNKRTIPTWKYKTDVNISRIPQVIRYADCTSSRCEAGNNVQPVYAPKLMAFALTDEDGVRKYSVQKKQVAVACVCFRLNVVRRCRKNKDGKCKTKRGKGKKRHGKKKLNQE
ncbi:uncharacterized protein LOC144925635 [Branchiostoma floridae x Branchiostoma belcheri]